MSIQMFPVEEFFLSVGERIRDLRNALKLTQDEFSSRIRISKGFLSNLEKGIRRPSDQLIKLMSYEFSSSENWLSNGEGEMFVSPSAALKNIMSRYNEQDIIEAFSAIMREHGLAVAAGRYPYRTDTSNPELDYMLNALYSLWSSGDTDMKGWIKIQFGRAFPKDVIEEALKKHKGSSEQTFVG